MESEHDEKLVITDKDSLRRRHAGNYKSLVNGEIYLLPYEDELKSKKQSFFDALSDFDYLKQPPSIGQLTLKALRTELMRLDDNTEGIDFWKNFNDSALKTHLNVILGTVKESKGGKDWRQTYLKQTDEKDVDKPHHYDMLRCMYLLAHMHKASPSYIRQLATVGCAWSTDLRVFYPRTDFAFSTEYGGYLAELYSNILYHQPVGVRKVLKYLDKLIEKLVQFSGSPFVAPMLKGRSEDIDSPGLKILKYNQIASITHFQALNRLLIEKITGPFTDSSFSQLEAREHQGLTTAQHYRLVAAQCLRMKIGVPSEKRGDKWYPVSADPIHQRQIDLTIEVYSNALAADALNGFKFESNGTKSGKKDTSIPSAIKKMAEQNPQTVDEILEAKSLDCANIPELYSKYMMLRTRYAAASQCGMGQQEIDQLRSNPNVEHVLDYIKGNNLEKIHADIEKLEKELAFMMFLSSFSQPINAAGNSTLIFEYDFHDLPDRI
jgi:hypothetical protein